MHSESNAPEAVPVFSVIVPVFNASAYLMSCIDSVLRQTERSFEIVIVDDGSTDDSLEVCRRLERDDPRIRVFTKENEGQGVARNVGIGHARGAYIVFLDSDDTLRSDACAQIREAFEKTGGDTVSFVIEFHAADGRSQARRGPSRAFVQDGEEIFTDAMLDRNFLSATCSKAYRRALLVEHGIRFPPLRAYEDAMFSRHVALHARRAVYLPEMLYFALTRPGSTSRKLSLRNFEIAGQLIERERLLFEAERPQGIDDALMGARIVRFFSHLLLLSAFWIDSAQERQTCLAIANAVGFSRYAKRRDVRRLLSTRTRRQADLARIPALARFAANIAKRFGINPSH